MKKLMQGHVRVVTCLGAAIVGVGVVSVGFLIFNHAPVRSEGRTRGTPAKTSQAVPVAASRGARRLPAPLPVPATFPDELATVHDLDPATAVDYGFFATPSAGPHHLFLAQEHGGGVCLVDLSRQAWAVGCNAELFATQPVMFEETFAGGPSRASMNGFVIAGIAQNNVASLDIVDQNGATHHIPISTQHAFVFQMPDASIQAGTQPTVMLARDKDGNQLGRVAGLAASG